LGRFSFFSTDRVYFSPSIRYIDYVLSIGPNTLATPSIYAPTFALSRLACGWYGIGHTVWRHPGDMRGTVVGKKGRFKSPFPRKEVMFRAQPSGR
jgi:hypothetical protein